MGVFKNEVGRPSNEVKKKRLIIKIVLGMLILYITFVLGYFVADISNKSEDNKTDNADKVTTTVPTTTVSIPEQEEISKEEASVIMERVFGRGYVSLIHYNGLSFSDDDYKTYLAIIKSKQNGNTCKDIYGTKLIENGIEPDIVEKENQRYVCHNEVYDYNDVEKTYKSLFGNDFIPLKKESKVTYSLAQQYDYIKEKDMYVIYYIITGDAGIEPIGDIINAYKKGDKVYISVAYATAWIDENLKDYHFKLSDGTKVTLTYDELKNETKISEYKDRLEQCEFIFFKENGVYKFEKVVKK